MDTSSPRAGGGCRLAPGRLLGVAGRDQVASVAPFQGVAEIRSGRDPKTPLALLACVPSQASGTSRALCHNDKQ